MAGKKQNIGYSEPALTSELGVTKVGEYFDFVVSVLNANECKLKIYKSGESKARQEIVLKEEHRFGAVFRIRLRADEIEGDCYAYEAFGKEFVDPYARRIVGRDVFGKHLGEHEKRLVRAAIDYETFDWKDDKAPNIPFSDMVLYKIHVRGFTKHESSGVRHKGTYLGVTEKLKYMKELGVNAVMLMPIVDFNEIMEEENLSYGVPSYTNQLRYQRSVEFQKQSNEGKYKVNYWGYSKDSFFFAPKASYASVPANVETEFKQMVKAFHANGIEVMIDMAFPSGMSAIMILDCLRYWVREYHVDGFRINTDISPETFIATDPYLARTKLLANCFNPDYVYGREVTPAFRNLAEYNDGFLVDVRRFLKGDEGQVSRVQERFRRNGEKCAVINYITDHNGFTLHDLYSYDVKHNQVNDEQNRDGTDYNYSWNCGMEGDVRKKKVKELRLQMMKNAMLLLFFSQGTPMLLAGDEFGNTQNGNNNAYCQDNEIGWLDWKKKKQNTELFDFIKQLIGIRKEHRVLHNTIELRTMDYISCGYPDISYHGVKAWYPDYSNYCRTSGIMLCGKYAMVTPGKQDCFFYFAINMHWEDHDFDLPDLPRGHEWVELLKTIAPGYKSEKISKSKKLDSKKEDGEEDAQTLIRRGFSSRKKHIVVPPRSIMVFTDHIEDTHEESVQRKSGEETDTKEREAR
ncbi:MAG: alpha-amylase [Lachnospiraceae bacterium]|nr:alpha-amylase [Lachnospiraceae bacterium]